MQVISNTFTSLRTNFNPSAIAVPNITNLFNNTVAGTSAILATGFTAVSANIIPVTVGVIAVSAILIFLWVKVYGPSHADAQTSQPTAPTSFTPTQARTPTPPLDFSSIPRATTPVPASGATTDSISATTLPRAITPEPVAAKPAPAKVESPRPTHSAPQTPRSGETAGQREMAHQIILSSGVPLLTELGDNQESSLALPRRLDFDQTTNKLYCRFSQDHKGYKAGQRYEVVGWMEGSRGALVVMNKVSE